MTTKTQKAPAESRQSREEWLAGIEAALGRAAEKARQRARAVNHPHACCRDGHEAGERTD